MNERIRTEIVTLILGLYEELGCIEDCMVACVATRIHSNNKHLKLRLIFVDYQNRDIILYWHHELKMHVKMSLQKQ